MTREDALEQIAAGITALCEVEHPGSLVTGWAIVYASQDTFGEDAPADLDTDSPRTQPPHTTFGLLALGADLVRASGE